MKVKYNRIKLNDIDFVLDNGALLQAKDLIEEYKEEYPDDMGITPRISRFYCQKGQFDQAERECQKALKNHIDSKGVMKDILIALGYCYFYQAKYNEALITFEKCYRMPDVISYTAQLKLADLYLLCNSRDDAIRVLEDTHNLPADNMLTLKKAKLLFDEGKYNEALDILESINDFECKKKELQEKYLLMGRSYYFLEDYDKSDYYFKKIDPTKTDTYWRSRYYLAKLKYKLGFIDEAIKILKESLKHDRFNGSLIFLVEMYFEKEYYDELPSIINELNTPERLIFQAKYELVLEEKQEEEKVSRKLIPKKKNNYKYNVGN